MLILGFKKPIALLGRHSNLDLFLHRMVYQRICQFYREVLFYTSNKQEGKYKMANKTSSKLSIAVIHPDLGIGKMLSSSLPLMFFIIFLLYFWAMQVRWKAWIVRCNTVNQEQEEREVEKTYKTSNNICRNL